MADPKKTQVTDTKPDALHEKNGRVSSEQSLGHIWEFYLIASQHLAHSRHLLVKYGIKEP